MKQRANNRRTRATRGAIVDSFNALVLEKPYENLQVAEVIDSADVGRSTFYEHFRNKDELLVRAMSPMLGVLAEAATPNGDAARIEPLLAHFAEFRPRTRALLHGPSQAVVHEALTDAIAARIAPMTNVPARIVASAAAGLQLSLILAWLDAIQPCPASQLAAGLVRATRVAVETLASPGTGRA